MWFLLNSFLIHNQRLWGIAKTYWSRSSIDEFGKRWFNILLLAISGDVLISVEHLTLYGMINLFALVWCSWANTEVIRYERIMAIFLIRVNILRILPSRNYRMSLSCKQQSPFALWCDTINLMNSILLSPQIMCLTIRNKQWYTLSDCFTTHVWRSYSPIMSLVKT